MPSPRRVRTILFTTLIGALVIIYLTTSSHSTQSSPFYTKTAALMNSRDSAAQAALDAAANAAAAVEEKVPAPRTVQAAVADITNMFLKVKASKEKTIPKAPSTAIDQDPTLRQRLQDAASEAKKSADSRFHQMQDAQKVVDATAAAAGAEKSVAGRKKVPTSSVAAVEQTEEEKEAAAAEAAKKEREAAEQAVRQELDQILAKSPVVIFSKSYCPYSMKGKHIMTEVISIEPTPFIVELDLHDKGHELQALLMKTTGRRTVPNILIDGKSLGGGDDVERLWRSGELAQKVKQMGNGKVLKVTENVAHPGEGEAGGVRRRRRRDMI